MQINDLLGANEIVRLKGTVTMFGNIQNIHSLIRTFIMKIKVSGI